MKIGHGSNSGIQEFRNLGIEGILSLLVGIGDVPRIYGL
jgi:hypothetical protein